MTSVDLFTMSALRLTTLFVLNEQDEIDVEAVAVGAILSDYQRIRVENV